MTLREAIEYLAKGYAHAVKDDARAKVFDQALDIALLAVAAHEAHCALVETPVCDYQMRNFRERFTRELFMQLRAAEKEKSCSTVCLSAL